MSTLTIGQVADRTGFSTSSLRYYEGIGLVVPAGRSDAGYRMYDASVLTRLSFVARAKQLGCTLEEITDLLAVWDQDSCGPVQRRFRPGGFPRPATFSFRRTRRSSGGG